MDYMVSLEMAFNVKPLQSLKIHLSACQMAIWCNGITPRLLVFRGDVAEYNVHELWKYITLLPLNRFIVSIMGIIWHFRQRGFAKSGVIFLLRHLFEEDRWLEFVLVLIIA
ncbi:hypothetical protein CEXT_115321 [Caerostris extrusa]|uniref:Uncharacterized protein n=1 Tax=Caerostris extrusa TaxID=172846 RepID=A0AAV4VVX7_CAEEX|nr:hypothetical protein CEXT_115321 [Caerostris extrusa]